MGVDGISADLSLPPNQHKTMKIILFLLFFGLLVLIGCEPQKSNTPDDKTAQGSDTIFEKRFLVEPSTAEIAENEIKELLAHSNLKEWRTEWALGGEFKSIGDFFPRYETDTSKGTLTWFIHDNVSGEPRIILACEGWHLDYTDMYPKSQLLTIPDRIFTFAGDSSEFKLEDHPSLSTRPGGRYILREEAESGTRHYQNNVMPRLYWRDTEPLNKDYGAFFQNNMEKDRDGKPVGTMGLLTRFVNQKGARGMRYYFALDSTEEQKNKIRIFLIATDSAGNNLLDRGLSKMDAPPIIIQKSIPPGGN